MSPLYANLLAAVLFVLTCHSTPVASYKILMLPISAKSHVFSMMAIAEGLASRGQEVTMVLSRNMKLDVPEVKNGKQKGIFVERYEDAMDDIEAIYDNITLKTLEGKMTMRSHFAHAVNMIESACHNVLVNNEPLVERLNNVHFDLAVIDASILAQCLYLLPHRLQIPYATYTDGTHPLVIRIPWMPSFVPNGVDALTDRMTFAERVRNAALLAAVKLIPFETKLLSDVKNVYRRHYGHFDSLEDLASRSVLWLIPRDHVLDYPRPTMPHVVYVGGLTVRRSSGELPADLRDFVERGTKGSVLVSFGSIASNFPVAIVEKFMDAFRRFGDDGLRFVFRLKDSRNVTIPDNVLIRKWIPQNDLLGHKSVKLFITHCGNNGQYEAVYHGVPMIGFPLFGDQPYNALRLEQKGIGIAMNIHSFTPEELVVNIHKILSDESYKNRTAKISAIFRSNPQSAIERAAYWIEHVCRFGGDHLRSGGQDLPLYAYMMLDILALVLALSGILIFCVWKLLAFAVRKCFARRGINVWQKQKKK